MTTALRGAVYALLYRILGLPGVRWLLRPLFRIDYAVRRVDPDADLDALVACAATLGGSRPEAIRRDFQQEFAAQDPRRWLFLIAKEPKGRVFGFARAMRQGPEQDWWIVGLGVRPLFRRRGIGEALVNAVLAHLRADGVSRVRLEVNRASRPAIALYRKLGFEEAPPPGGRTGDGGFLQMALDLRGEGLADCPGQFPPV